MTTHEARDIAAALRAQWTEPGARVGKRQALNLVSLVERLAGEVDQARRELQRRDDLTTPYGELVKDWNGLLEALRGLGIEVSQPADLAPRWEWRWGRERGAANTIPAAYLAALLVAGARRPEEGVPS